MKKLRFEVAALTDAGIGGRKNEDSYICRVIDARSHYAGIFAVADGVGGLQKGEMASLTAVSDINKWWESLFREHYNDEVYIKQSLTGVFEFVNEKLIKFGVENNIKLATTMSALLLYKNRYIIVHTGDSRIYLGRRGFFAKCRQLTHDYSIPVKKEIDGRIFYKWMLTDCLGNTENFKKFVSEGEIQEGDIFIVCSDGVYKTMELNKIKSLMKKHGSNPKTFCGALVEQAKKNGETDNISVIVVKISV